MPIKSPVEWQIWAKMHTFHQKSLSLHRKPAKQLVLLRSVIPGTHILSKQNFLLLQPSSMPSWISQSAINYANLCWQFQILQTVLSTEHFGIWHFLQKETIWFSKVLASPGTLQNVLMRAYFRVFPMEISVFFFFFLFFFHWKSSTFIRKPAKIWLCHSWYWVYWPSWTPSWISQLAISYASLCRQFQKLQTMPNILVYDTSCSSWGSGLPLEIVVFLAHSYPTITMGRGITRETRSFASHFNCTSVGRASDSLKDPA